MWQDYLSKSVRNLAATERDLESGSYDLCVSRDYFSTFQAAISALLALTDFQRRGRYWDHGEIAAEFVRRLIHRRKVFPQTMASTLDDLNSRRHQADYDRRQISQRVAERSLGKARQLVQQVHITLQEQRAP
jgi:uncharacterized protein (UPF0332 family)